MADRKPWEEFSNTTSSDAAAEKKPWEAFGGETKPEPKGFLGHARDLGLSAVKSAIAVPEAIVGLADIPTGGRVGKFLENEGGSFGFRPKEAKEILSDLHTDQYKAQQQEFQDADGVIAKTGVALHNPSLIANTVVESAAPMLAGGAVARGVRAVAPKVGTAAAGAIGEGTTMAGSQAEAIRQETEDGLLTPVQTGAAVATGALGTLFGYLGGRVAQHFGFGDVDTMFARGARPDEVAAEIAKLPPKSIPRQVVEGAIAEGFLEELPQSISEQIIQNLALGKPWADGVEDAAVMGTLAGMAMGGGASLYNGMTRPATPSPGEGQPGSAGEPGPAADAPPVAPPAAPAGMGFNPEEADPALRNAWTAARVRAAQLAAEEAGAPDVPQTAPPDGRAILAAQQEAERLALEAEIARNRAVESPDDEILQATGRAPLPSEQMGLNPAAGPLSAAAALAVDTGATDALQQAAQAVDPETGEILQAGARVPEQKRDLTTPEKIRERLQFIEHQARANGGWSRPLVEERDRLRDALAKAEPAADHFRDATEMVEAGTGQEPLKNESPADTGLELTPPAFDQEGAAKALGSRTPEQLQHLAEKGKPGWKEAAQAEIQRRAEPSAAQETVDGAQRATGPAAASATPAAADATGAKWDAMSVDERAAILAQKGGWSAKSGFLNVVGKRLMGQAWKDVPDSAKARIERLAARGDQVDPTERAPAADQAAGVPERAAPEQAASQEDSAEIEAAAHQAATSPKNDLPEPTPAQKEAGNYAKGHVRVHGLEITVENPRGSERSGTRPDGTEWRHTMSDHYGYIRRTEGADGEQVDVYVGPSPESQRVFVVDQVDQQSGRFDEHKVMLGFGDEAEAIRAYRSNFDAGWKVGPVRTMSMDEFKTWLKDGDTAAPAVEKAAPPAPAQKKPRGVLAKKAQAAAQARAEYFAPGNVVKSYSGHDRVISYTEPDADGVWTVTVRAVERDGDRWVDVPGGVERTHTTEPDARTLKAGPVLRAEMPQAQRSAEFPLPAAASSYSGISHSGNARAKADAEEFQRYLDAAREAGEAVAHTAEQKAAVQQAADGLRADYLAQYRRLMDVRAGTYSGFVAGGSKLNARQADRRNSAYDRAIDTFVAWQNGNKDRVRQAVLDARTGEQKQADQDAAEKARADKEQRRADADRKLMARILSWKKGGEPVTIGKNAVLAGVNTGRDGYPTSVKLAPTDGSTLTDDKFDLAALFRRKGMSVPESKRLVRELVDAVRAEDTASAAAAEQPGGATAPAAPGAAVAEASKTPLLDAHIALMRSVREGEAELDEFKQAFSRTEAARDAIAAELNTMKKDDLLRTGGYSFAYRHKDERKAEIVEALVSRVLEEFALGRSYGPSSYVMSAAGLAAHRQAKVEALRELVANTTEADLQAHAREVEAARAEVASRKEAQAKTLADPRSLADFRAVMRHYIEQGDTRQQAFLRLSPEQRKRYDDLEAESTKEAREQAKAKQRTRIATAGQSTTGTIIETKHTRDHYDLFVVQLGERVSREDYDTLNAAAKRMGGWYSKFRGNGAVPGFQFKTRDAAEAFSKLVAGDATEAQTVAEARRDAFEDDRSQSAAERLRTMAAALEQRADEALSRDRKTNTERRARMANSAEAAARADKALAGTMSNLARAIEAGTVKFLDGVRQKVQVEFLASELRNAKDAQIRAKYPTYGEQERHRGEPVDAETVDYATFPSYTAMRSDLAGIARQMLEIDGTKKLGARLMSVADDVSEAYTEWAKANLLQVSRFARGDGLATFKSRHDAERAIRRSGIADRAIVLPIKRGENRVVLSPSEAMKQGLWDGDGDKRITLASDFGRELVEAIGRRASGQIRLPWQLESAYEKRKRLEGMGIFTGSEYRAALREFADLQEAIATPDKIKQMERAMIGRRNDGLDFFPTSEAVVDTMLDAAQIEMGMAVLEPSAGMGHIADAIREKVGIEPDVVELSGERRELLEAKGYNLVGSDFTEMKARQGFTYGDVFRDKDGTLGVMRGSSGMGSNRVGFQPLDENGEPDVRRARYADRDELVGVEHRGSDSGYDRIIMNPPFSNGRDIEHVRHAYSLLRPGGRIVAIMGEGAFFRSNKAAEDFRAWLDELGATSEKLPDGSFLDPSLPVNTGVSARMVVIDKPVGERTSRDQEASDERASEVQHSFAGRNALTADRHALASAQRRIAVGEDAEAVRQDTGWHRGADGRWRFEISDDQARLMVGGQTAAEMLEAAAIDGGIVRVADVLDHPQLFAAYPHLADIRVEPVPEGERAAGRLLRSMGGARLQLRGDIRRQAVASVMLHELQHAIQHAEGFAIGGSKKALMSDLDKSGAETYRRLAGEVEARNTQTRQRMTGEQRRAISPELTADVPTDEVIVTFNGRAVDNAATPKNMGSRLPVTERGLLRALNLQFKGLVKPVKAMLARGRAGKRGGLVMIDSADPLRIAHAFASRTGRALDGAIELFSEAGSINGFYDPKSGLTFLVGPNLDPVTAPAVLLHEMIHGQQRAKIDARAMDMLRNRGSVKDPALRGFLDRVAERMVDAGAASDSKEAAAYIVEQAVIEGRSQGFTMADSRFLGWVDSTLGQRIGDLLRSMIAAVRGWMMRNGLGVQSLTVDDLVGYAMSGVDRAAQGEAAASAAASSASVGRSGLMAELESLVRTMRRVRGSHQAKAVRDEIVGRPLTNLETGTVATVSVQSWDKMRSQSNVNRSISPQAHMQALGNLDTLFRLATLAQTRPGKKPQDAQSIKAIRHFVAPMPFDGDVLEVRILAKEFVDPQQGNRLYLVEALEIDSAGVVGDDPVVSGQFRRGDAASSPPPDAGTTLAQMVAAVKRGMEADGDIQFSRSGLRDLASRATAEINQTLTAPGKVSWWHKTIGTMYNLAERAPAFKPVFQSAQGFIDDVSHYAADAAERAPKLLPRLDTWRDILKTPISAEDNAAVAKPVFEGTLAWTRDAEGRAVRLDALEQAAESLSTDEKAQELVERDKLDAGMLRAWRGMPADQYVKLVNSRYESEILKPGVVWTDDELRSMFKLNDAQIALYREFRAAVDRSLDTMARAEMLRFAGEDLKHMRDDVMEAESLRNAAVLLVNELQTMAQEQPDRAEQLLATAQGIVDRRERVEKLQAEGYAPLSRFGKYTVDVVVDGNREYFGLFETAREANKMADRMRAEFGAGAVTQGTLSDEAFKLFAGITPESLELFGNMLGLDSTGDEAQDRAFQEYLRLTKTNRSALRRLIHRKGIAGFSEDVGRVLASFVYSNARQTAAGLHMGDLSKSVNAIPKEQGELKDVAVKLAEYIKNPQEEAQAIRGLLFAQYLGGSFASAFVNMTQPAAVTFPWLSQHGGAKLAATEIGKAARQIATRGHKYEPDLAAALKKAEEDGVVSPQEVHQLMAQARGSGSLKAGDGTRAGELRAAMANGITRLSVAWGKFFSAAEQLNRRITFIAAYRVAKQRGIASPEAFARRAVQETQFVYSRASKMQWGRGAVGGTLMTFKTYSVAYLELMSRLWSQGEPGSPERAAGRKAVALMLGMLLLMGGGGGLPFMEDAEDLIDGIAQIAGYNFSVKKARQQFLIDTFGADAADFIERGVSGLPGVPLDVSGRLGLGNLVPGTGIFLDRTNHTRDVLELLGPAGDFGSRIVSGTRKVISGDVAGGLLEVSPVAIRNLEKGVDMAATGQYRDYRGYKVLDTTDLEAAFKAAGFQPAGVAKIQDANYLNQRAKDFYSMRAQQIRSKWAEGIYEKDAAKVQEARDMVAEWNRRNPMQPMIIRMPDILRRVREMGKDKSQRIADAAPRAMRQQLREELMLQ